MSEEEKNKLAVRDLPEGIREEALRLLNDMSKAAKDLEENNRRLERDHFQRAGEFGVLD